MSVPIWNQDHTHFQKACDDVNVYLNRDYNFLDCNRVIELLGGELFESIYIPEREYLLDAYLRESNKTINEVRQEYIDDYGADPDGDDIVDYLRDELEQFRCEITHYPTHEVLYEARSEHENIWIMNNKHELYALGISVIKQTSRFNAMLFTHDDGNDFHTDCWIQMYCMRNWITENKY